MVLSPSASLNVPRLPPYRQLEHCWPLPALTPEPLWPSSCFWMMSRRLSASVFLRPLIPVSLPTTRNPLWIFRSDPSLASTSNLFGVLLGLDAHHGVAPCSKSPSPVYLAILLTDPVQYDSITRINEPWNGLSTYGCFYRSRWLRYILSKFAIPRINHPRASGTTERSYEPQRLLSTRLI